MKSDEIRSLFSQFEAVASELDGIECWSARELQYLLGYSKWENFEKVIQKAKDACNNSGVEVDDHFPDVKKTIPMPKGAEKEISQNLHCFHISSSFAPIVGLVPMQRSQCS